MIPVPEARSRSLLLGVGGILALVILVSAVFSHLDVSDSAKCVGLLLVLGNVACIPVMLWRGSRVPEERKGWLAFAASQGLAIFGNVLMSQTVAAREMELRSAHLIWLCNQGSIALLQAWALQHWPWPRRENRHISHNLVGAALFCLSLTLLFWTMVMSFPPEAGTALPIIQLGTILRVAIVAGTCLFLLSEEPSRANGVLGLVSAYIFIAVIVAFQLQTFMHHPEGVPRWSMGLAFPGPLFLCLAALAAPPIRQPLGPESGLSRSILVESLTYAPFLLSGSMLAHALRLQQHDLFWPFLGFALLGTLQVLREVLLLRELRFANAHLESRVQERTQSLEELQSVMLRTERMNMQAMLGAGITHDLNNLLCAMSGRLELAQRKLQRGEAMGTDQVQALLDVAWKATALTQRVMALGRDATPMVDQEAQKHLLGMADLLRMLIGRKIKLHLDLPQEPIAIALGKDQVEQIVMNLVGNARDAMPEGGEITLKLEKASEGFARLSVSDTGTGIDPEHLPHLFEAYFTTKAPGKGTGLGLASIKLIVEEAGGRISVQSKLGAGTTFEVELPLA